MHALLNEKKPSFEAALEHLKKELGTLRTGRANPALVEEIPVTAYDSTMELKSVASITVSDAKTLLVDPWDKSLLTTVEKAIRDADVGVNPSVDGEIIRISIPLMTEETRTKLAKKVSELLEDARIAMRKVREATRDEIGKMEKEKTIAEDEKFKMFDELDKMTKDFTSQAEELGKKKEEEIMTV